MALNLYRKKRNFAVTPEPRGRRDAATGHRFVIQKHAARRLHYDLRLELDGVMKSWAVTRGPSLDPDEKRLAVEVEDHPVEYNSFEGTIPAGEYGGGTVLIWDRGRWSALGDPHKGLAKGHLEFELDGEKLHGRWHLVRMRPRAGERRTNWLLIKGKDEAARGPRGKDILTEAPRSVASGRSIEEIEAGKGKKRVWHSNRSETADPPARKTKSSKTVVSKSAVSKTAVSKTVGSKARASKPTGSKTRGKQKSGKSSTSDRSDARRGTSTPAKRRSSTKPAAVPSPRKTGKVAPKGRARLPDFVPPSLATLRTTAPSGPAWLHEIKFDGYRIEARLDHGKVRLLTRNRQDWTDRFPLIAAAVASLPADTALIDGELVAEDHKGVSDFSLLQTDLKAGRDDRFVYWAFDLLHLDGRDLMAEPLIDRKDALHRLIGRKRRAGPIRYTEHLDDDGPTVFAHAAKMGLEGIVSKRRDATYYSGRSENFIKVKSHDRQEFIVAGFSPSTAQPHAVGALTVAFHERGRLRYAGRIGTGYTRTTAHELWKRLTPLKTERAPVELPADERRKNVIWVKPSVVIEAEFRGLTGDGLLRQAAYKGLREDKPAREVVHETPPPAALAQRQSVRKSAQAKKTSRKPQGGKGVKKNASTAGTDDPPTKPAARARPTPVEIADVRLSHPDRVYWPDAGVTKQDLANYYVGVWDAMAPHIVGRPLAIVRCPEGIAGECFFQKHIGAAIKQSPLRHAVRAKEHDVIAVERLDELIALVQSGALEIHVRGSRLDRLEACDRLVFDLDPGEGLPWKAVVAGAVEIRDRLAALKLKSFAKLTGGKGIHVMVPIADADWDTAKDFTERIAAAMTADSPELYLAKMTKALRDGKIFIDYLRNSREATSVAIYSTRARPGAPVSAPLTWEALRRSTAGNQFNVLNIARHRRDGQEPWRDIGRLRQRLPE